MIFIEKLEFSQALTTSVIQERNESLYTKIQSEHNLL